MKLNTFIHKGHIQLTKNDSEDFYICYYLFSFELPIHQKSYSLSLFNNTAIVFLLVIQPYLKTKFICVTP